LMEQLDASNAKTIEPDVVFHQPESFNSYKVKE